MRGSLPTLMSGMNDLVAAYDALGTPMGGRTDLPEFIIPSLEQKLTNPPLLAALGVAPEGVKACYHLELCANLLDAFSESSDRKYLWDANRHYLEGLRHLVPETQARVRIALSAALPHFFLEEYTRSRLGNATPDTLLVEEAVEYLFRRGADATVYGEIAREHLPGYPALLSGFRIRQALWDLRDDVEDQEEDKANLGVNLCSMLNRDGLEGLSKHLANSALRRHLPGPLAAAIRDEYEATVRAIREKIAF